MILPEVVLSQHLAVLGKTGSGKTFAVKGLVEWLLSKQRRVGIVDPTGAWWGLRSSADGRGAGFPILVLGGDHGDLPLPALGGAAVARLLVEQGVNLVADTSQLTVGERTRWFIDFATTLHRLNRSPLHLVMDEAHMFAPQGKVPDPDTGKMLHAANTLASGGRSRGIRLAMITQRPQKLHKDALTSADTLIAMRVLAPQDRLAVEEWIKGCGDMAAGKEVLNTLASLQRGEGWAWYPEGGFLKRLKFPPITTFDSSATPADGHTAAQPKGSAEIDLTEIKAALADAVREAEANDPKRLRARIAELEREGRKAVSTISPSAVADAEQRGYVRGHADALRPYAGIGVTLSGLIDSLTRLRDRTETAPQPIQSRAIPSPVVVRAASVRHDDTGGSLPRAERLILTALAQHPQGRTKTQVAVLTGYAVNGGAFNNSLGALRTKEYITRGEPITITDAGLSALGSYEPLPSGPDLLRYWYGQLGKAEMKALEALAEVYPKTLSKAQVAMRAGYEPDGGAFNNALGRLRTLELIKGRGELKASDELF